MHTVLSFLSKAAHAGSIDSILLQSMSSSSDLKVIMYTESYKQKNMNNKQISELNSNRNFLKIIRLMKGLKKSRFWIDQFAV